MKLIQPNCRVQITREDVACIAGVLGRDENDIRHLTELLIDEDSRDRILDSERLFRVLTEEPGCVKVSLHLFFYVVVRRLLKQAGIGDRMVADYVAELLTEFSEMERVRVRAPGGKHPLDYVFEMLAALQESDELTRFLLRVHLGNHSLFWAGVFPKRVRSRAELKGFPDISYYDTMGGMSYREARDHRLARHYNLDRVYSFLADEFRATREALNDLSDRVLFLGWDN